MARKYKAPVDLTERQQRTALKKLHRKWTAHNAQKKILRSIYADGYKKVFIRAGRKFGKNELLCYLVWRTCISIRRAETYIIGVTAEDEKKIIWENDRIQDFGPNFGQTVNDTKLLMRFPWGSFSQIDGCRNAKSGTGRTFDLVGFDEAKDQKKDYFDAAYPNLLAKDGVIVFIGTPPDIDDPDGDFWREREEEALIDPSWAHFRFTSYDNPHVSKEWLDREREAYIRRGEEYLFDREYLAKDVSGTRDKIFPMFTDAFHSRPLDVLQAELKGPMQEGNVEFFAMADPGQDVFAVLFMAYNKATSQIYVLDEIYETDRYKTSTRPMWRATQKAKKRLYDFPLSTWDDVYDEAGSWYEVGVMTEFQQKIRATQKKRGRDKLDHVSLLKDAMTVPRGFQVADHCTNTKNEIKRLRDINTDKKNHVIDLLRYFVDEVKYEYQETTERYTEEEMYIATPRGYTLEQDMAAWEQATDPYAAVLDFNLDTSGFGHIFGF